LSPAFYLLLLGPFGVFYGIFEWLANPVLLAAWVFSFAGKNKIALLLGVVASALMLAFLFRHTTVASEAPTYAKIIGYGAGYWLWLTRAGLVMVSGATGLVKQRQGRLPTASVKVLRRSVRHTTSDRMAAHRKSDRRRVWDGGAARRIEESFDRTQFTYEKGIATLTGFEPVLPP
jgi:hypothetical protein